MENLIRVSDILVFDAKTKDEKKDFNIADVILSHKGYVSGIVISGKGLFGIKRYASVENIEKIEKDSIIINGYCKFKPEFVKNLQYSSTKLLKKKVVSEDGVFMGILSDFYNHSEKKRVMAVEVARSFFEDLFTGRTLIPGNIIADESDAIIITEIQLENKLHNTKGIITAIDDGISRS